MPSLPTLLRISAPIFCFVGLLHLAFGLQADVWLGAVIPDAVRTDPALDSQNRFYGVSFVLYGVLLWLSAGDLVRHAPVLRCLIAVFFAAGCARLVSCAVTGVPPAPVIVLAVSELVLPPVVWVWLGRIRAVRA